MTVEDEIFRGELFLFFRQQVTRERFIRLGEEPGNADGSCNVGVETSAADTSCGSILVDFFAPLKVQAGHCGLDGVEYFMRGSGVVDSLDVYPYVVPATPPAEDTFENGMVADCHMWRLHTT